MINRFREIFYYSRRQRNGLWLLCALVVVLLSGLIYIRHYMPLAQVDPEEFQAFVAQWQVEDSLSLVEKGNEQYLHFAFDPNQASDSVLRALGFPARLSQTIRNYTSKGGRFKQAEDLLRIYGMDTALYQEIKEWVLIEDGYGSENKGRTLEVVPPISVSDTFDLNIVSMEMLRSFGLMPREAKGIIGYRERFKPFQTPDDLYDVYNLDSPRVELLLPYAQVINASIELDSSNQLGLVELNRADSASLLGVKGLGPYFSGHIIAYRQKLGGYVDFAQLLEIPGMDSLRLKRAQLQLTLDPELVSRININERGI
jgi:competence protein ComEA